MIWCGVVSEKVRPSWSDSHSPDSWPHQCLDSFYWLVLSCHVMQACLLHGHLWWLYALLNWILSDQRMFWLFHCCACCDFAGLDFVAFPSIPYGKESGFNLPLIAARWCSQSYGLSAVPIASFPRTVIGYLLNSVRDWASHTLVSWTTASLGHYGGNLGTISCGSSRFSGWLSSYIRRDLLDLDHFEVSSTCLLIEEATTSQYYPLNSCLE